MRLIRIGFHRFWVLFGFSLFSFFVLCWFYVGFILILFWCTLVNDFHILEGLGAEFSESCTFWRVWELILVRVAHSGRSGS